MDKIKQFFINFWNADTKTKLRIISVVIGAVNLILYLIGKDAVPVTAQQIWTGFTTIYTSITSVIAMWKNNSITPEAKAGDELMKALKNSVYEETQKDEFITEDEIEDEEEVIV